MCAEEQESQSASLPYPRPARSGEVGELVTVHRTLRLQSAYKRNEDGYFKIHQPLAGRHTRKERREPDRNRIHPRHAKSTLLNP